MLHLANILLSEKIEKVNLNVRRIPKASGIDEDIITSGVFFSCSSSAAKYVNEKILAFIISREKNIDKFNQRFRFL